VTRNEQLELSPTLYNGTKPLYAGNMNDNTIHLVTLRSLVKRSTASPQYVVGSVEWLFRNITVVLTVP